MSVQRPRDRYTTVGRRREDGTPTCAMRTQEHSPSKSFRPSGGGMEVHEQHLFLDQVENDEKNVAPTVSADDKESSHDE